MKQLLVALFVCIAVPVSAQPSGKRYRTHPSAKREQRVELRRNAMEMLLHWNHVAIDATGLDHMPVNPGGGRVFGEQFGPARAARAMAIVHIAIFDAMSAIEGNRTYTRMLASRHASIEAAIAYASHDTLVAMFPSQAGVFDISLLDDMANIPDEGSAKRQGARVGQRAAKLILHQRAHDGSQHAEPLVNSEYITGTGPGEWQQDPISKVPLALGAYWHAVTPFVLPNAQRYRAKAPPALTSDDYTRAYQEVLRLGGDDIITPSERTADQTHSAMYWAYDGVPSLCAPPRLYNQLAVQIADQMGTDALGVARLLALSNMAMADAAIVAWDTKYHFRFWRPITAIRAGDTDGNPLTIPDAHFSPLGAPASNLQGPNFTPPFPAYISGHATFGGAVFQVLRRFYGTDDIAFTFVSDEFNGVTVDNTGATRPLLPRSFYNLSQAEEENGQSRIYLGIHFAFDKTEGIARGRLVGDYVFNHALN